MEYFQHRTNYFFSSGTLLIPVAIPFITEATAPIPLTGFTIRSFTSFTVSVTDDTDVWMSLIMGSVLDTFSFISFSSTER